MIRRSPTELSWYTFVHDFTDRGVDAAVRDVLATGASGIAVAMVYHSSRDLLPRNPRRKIRYMTGGRHYYQPDGRLYPTELPTPPVDPELGASDPVRDISVAADRNGLRFDAWVVFGHDSMLATERPDLAQKNAFGDVMSTDLCPNHPLVRRRAVALVLDVARYGPASILAESLHFHGLRHGYHHERYLFEVGWLADLALSLCFCDPCLESARQDGIDIDRVQAFARHTALDAFEGRTPSTSAEARREDIRGLVDGELAALIDHRDGVVASLAAETAEAAASRGVELVFIDPSGATKGYSDGRPVGALAVDSGVTFGVDSRLLAGRVPVVEMLGYARDIGRIEADLVAYEVALAGSPTTVRLSLRPSHVDTIDHANLAAKVNVAERRGVDRVDLYHYGLLASSAHEMVRMVAAERSLDRVGP